MRAMEQFEDDGKTYREQKKITETLMQCRNLRCGCISQVEDCVPDDRIVASVPKNLLIEKKYEGLLRCPKCGSVVNQINKG